MFAESEYYDEKFQEIAYTEQELESVRFYDCTFTGCTFTGTAFRECKFSGCTFVDCDLNGIRVTDSHFSQVRFERCRLVGINWTEADWPRLRIPGLLTFEESVLNHATFIGLELPECAMRTCMAKDVDFREAVLARSDLTGTDFSESVFDDTDLTGADLSHAANYRIDPMRNRIAKAKFMLPEALSLLYCMDIRIDD